MKINFKYFYSNYRGVATNVKNMLFLDYNRYQNGNAEIYLAFYSINFIIYINGLKKHIRTYKQFINLTY